MPSSPGQAEYKVRLKDQGGLLVAEFDAWRSLAFAHKVNNRGNMRLEIDGNDSRVDLFELDGQIEIWRQNLKVDLPWYKEWEGLHRSTNDLLQPVNDKDSFVAYGFSYLDLARRAYIMWRAGTAEATKNAVAETVMKELVIENIGADALVGAGRIASNVYPGLIVQADGAGGPTWEDSMENDNLLATLQRIGLFTVENSNVIDFDIVSAGNAVFEFRTYAGQRGTDRTQGNPDSNDPVIFSTDFANMDTPMLKQDRTNEITAVYALGRGTDAAQQIELATSVDINDSPWNRIEMIVNTATSGDDQSGQLTSAAEARLEEGKFDEMLTFDVLQTEATYYGKHYTWGDLVTVRYKDYSASKKLVSLQATVSQNAEGEIIRTEFMDK